MTDDEILKMWMATTAQTPNARVFEFARALFAANSEGMSVDRSFTSPIDGRRVDPDAIDAKYRTPLNAPLQSAENRECKCTMAQRMTGDGCDVCNPELAKELSEENRSEPLLTWVEQLKALYESESAFDTGWRMACDRVIRQITETSQAEKRGASGVYTEIADERRKQDEQWGGPDHDDLHSPDDFMRYVRRQISLAALEGGYRSRFIKVAALAVAAIESLDRKEKQ